MMLLIVAALFLLGIYGLLLLWSLRGLGLRVDCLGLRVQGLGEPVSVVVAMRNEASHVEQFLRSILSQEYPRDLLEIIVVDDHSEDETVLMAKGFSDQGIQILQLEPGEGQGKKAAIRKGILFAKHEHIVVTDADCRFRKQWLSRLVECRKKNNAVMVVAPVMLMENRSLLNIFQTLDFISLQGMTMVGVNTGLLNMCNGANLMYKKSAFMQVRGFEGIDHVATGDDMLLMEKFSEAFPGKMSYCYDEEAVVETASPDTLKSFMQQRIRWAGKSTVYKSKTIKAILLLVYMLNLVLCSLFAASLFNKVFFVPLLAMTLVKSIIELPFMYQVASFFNRKKLLWWFLPMQPLHHAYIVLAGFFGLAGRVEWKGRRV